MSNQIETHRVQRYFDGITILAQQRMSRLRNAVRVESGIVGRYAYFDQVAATSMVEKTTRHSDTPLIEVPHRRRRLELAMYHTADLIDENDQMQIINDPTNAYGQVMAMAAGRKIDEVIYDAFFGTANTGESGGTPTAFPAGGDYDVGSLGGEQAMDTGNVLIAKGILDAAENDPMIRRHAVVDAERIHDLLESDSLAPSSSDYNTVKALVQGEINTWCGFNWIRYESLDAAQTAGSVQCPFFCENSMLFGIAQDIRGRLSERPDKDYSTQVYYSLRFGATRMDETGVVRFYAS